VAVSRENNDTSDGFCVVQPTKVASVRAASSRIAVRASPASLRGPRHPGAVEPQQPVGAFRVGVRVRLEHERRDDRVVVVAHHVDQGVAVDRRADHRRRRREGPEGVADVGRHLGGEGVPFGLGQVGDRAGLGVHARER